MGHYNLDENMIISGIDSAYKLAKKNKKIIENLIHYYHSKLTRVILKPTSYYYNLLRRSVHQALLINPEKRRRYLEQSLESQKKILSAVMKYEVEDLMNFNIPFFYFKNGELYSVKNELIKQNIMFSSINLIFSSLKDLKKFKNKVVETILLSG